VLMDRDIEQRTRNAEHTRKRINIINIAM